MEIEPTPLYEISSELLTRKGVQLFIKREDLNHPEISGNKFRKLKYNLLKAREEGYNTLLTFGGAFSNHIYATAAAGKVFGFKTVGIIRGEEHLPLNPTLSFAKKCGMEIYYMNRTDYREKSSERILCQLKGRFGSFYLLPEGGTNDLAIKGCEEILSEEEKIFDYYALAVGTGGTVAGLIQGLKGKGEIIGFSALKGSFLTGEVQFLFEKYKLHDYKNWHINNDYHFGGYAKTKPELLAFIQKIEEEHQLPLDPVYTGKTFFGLLDMVAKGAFEKGSKILFIHTGGLQGRAGFGL